VTGRARAEAALSEADWQRRVMDTARLHHWRCVHIRAAKVGTRHMTPYEGDGGLPDLVLARAGRVILAELKAEKGAMRPGQAEWLEAAGEHGRLWRPSHWADVIEALS
jgi:hypothetical protein